MELWLQASSIVNNVQVFRIFPEWRIWNSLRILCLHIPARMCSLLVNAISQKIWGVWCSEMWVIAMNSKRTRSFSWLLMISNAKSQNSVRQTTECSKCLALITKWNLFTMTLFSWRSKKILISLGHFCVFPATKMQDTRLTSLVTKMVPCSQMDSSLETTNARSTVRNSQFTLNRRKLHWPLLRKPRYLLIWPPILNSLPLRLQRLKGPQRFQKLNPHWCSCINRWILPLVTEKRWNWHVKLLEPLLQWSHGYSEIK